jgi:predicted exporter
VVSTLLIGTLLIVYRSVILLLLVPAGDFWRLAGLAAVALRFNVVYAITLAFGITLIGEAVTYSRVLIRAGRAHARQIRRGLAATRLLSLAGHMAGHANSVCGFASLCPRHFEPRAARFVTIVGLIAALATRFVLPSLCRPATIDTLRLPTRQWVGHCVRARFVIWPLALLAVCAVSYRGQLGQELSGLSPGRSPISVATQTSGRIWARPMRIWWPIPAPTLSRY